MEELLRLVDLSKYYTSSQAVVVGVNTLNLSFSRGEFVAVTGESGSGKSTLSQVLGGILPYESGEMLLSGKPTSHYDGLDWQRYRRDYISFISQNYGILPGLSVQENVRMALRLAGMDSQEAAQAAKPLLEQVELWQLRRHRAGKLSSGQKQRLAIARALAKKAPILIADEPTGNLDDANSQKVMQLLALAARDRLVILVTHEFPEAAPYATRHIVLQDGKVAADAPLRPSAPPQPLEQPRAKSQKSLSPLVARAQVAGRPVWCALLTVLLTLTAFGVFAFLGTFLMNLDDSFTRIYDPDTFANGDPNRIVVATADGRPLTQADYQTILAQKYVVQLERNGYVTDVQYAFREGVDYTVTRSEEIQGSMMDAEHVVFVYYNPLESAPFMQTLPLLPTGEVEIQGTAPENFYEVVAAQETGLSVGDRVRVFLTSRQLWGKYQKMDITVTVTATTAYGTGLYFHNDVGRMLQQVVATGNGGTSPFFIPDDLATRAQTLAQQVEKLDLILPEGFSLALEDGQMQVHPSLVVQWKASDWDETMKKSVMRDEQGEIVYFSFPGKVEVPDSKGISHFLELGKTHTQSLTRLFQVSQSTFDRLTVKENSQQVSIRIRDYAYADRVMEALEKQGYETLSPYRFGSGQVDPVKAEQRKQTLTVCLGALAAVCALLVVVLVALFGTQLENYRLLRDLGLVRKTARLSVLWQVLAFTLVGQGLCMGLLGLCNLAKIERIVALLHYVTVPLALLLGAVHLVLALVGTAFVIFALDRRVFPLARIKFDLPMETEV